MAAERENGPDPAAALRPAAEYIRMSTEHQQYSTANQADVIREYALRRGFEVVRTYADEGKSGLRIEGRKELKRLLADAQAGSPGFVAVLVYDVSRWGRFQDADESAYYEYLLKRAGVEVRYCAEQFENDGGPASTIIKSVKRAMAGEYSRELSAKVFQGQCRLIELGYRQGGAAGYGLRRMLVDQARLPKGTLRRGEQKSIQTDRVVLVHGPEEEVEAVRWMYRAFTADGKSEAEIAAELNARGLVTDLGRPWNRGTVRQVLTNEKYAGHNVYNRTSFKLKRKHVANPPENWVRRDAAFEPLVSPDLFYTARGIVLERNRRVSDEEMIRRLRLLLESHPALSAALIDASEAMPSSAAYRSRFGSLVAAYRLAGFVPDRDYSFLDVNRRLRSLRPGFLDDVVRRLGAAGAVVRQDPASGLLLINGEYSAAVSLSRCRQTPAGSLRWSVTVGGRLAPDITILARMDAANERPADYYLLPVMDVPPSRLLVCEANGAYLDTYRFETLDFFTGLAARRPVGGPI